MLTIKKLKSYFSNHPVETKLFCSLSMFSLVGLFIFIVNHALGLKAALIAILSFILGSIFQFIFHLMFDHRK